jgi:hypothetical protein
MRDDDGSLQQSFGGRVDQVDAVIEIQHDDAGGRDVEDAPEEVVLLLNALPLGAQAVDHPVVHRDQPIDFGLADADKPCRVVAVVQELRAVAHERERPEHAPYQHDAGRERGQEHDLDREEPQRVLTKDIQARHRQQRMDDGEVQGEAGAERQDQATGCRRQAAAGIGPEAGGGLQAAACSP